MTTIATADVYAALDRAAAQLRSAGGADGIVSRKDIRAKLLELDGAERQLVDVLYRFIDGRDAARSDRNAATAETAGAGRRSAASSTTQTPSIAALPSSSSTTLLCVATPSRTGPTPWSRSSKYHRPRVAHADVEAPRQGGAEEDALVVAGARRPLNTRSEIQPQAIVPGTAADSYSAQARLDSLNENPLAVCK